MKTKLYYLSLILSLVFGMMTLTACGSDDDDGGNASGGGEKEDFGSDGLKGYWVQNVWQDIVVEQWTDITYYPRVSYETTETKGQVTMMIELDGEGGGTMHTSVTTLDRVNNDSKFVSTNWGAFYDTADGSTKEYYSFDKFYWHDRYSSNPSNNKDYSFTTKKDIVSALTYYVRGSTIEIFYDNTTQKMDLNVTTGSKTTAGNVSNYHRLRKAN